MTNSPLERPADVAKRVLARFDGRHKHIDVTSLKFDLQTLKLAVTLYELEEKIAYMECDLNLRLEAEGCVKQYQYDKRRGIPDYND